MPSGDVDEWRDLPPYDIVTPVVERYDRLILHAESQIEAAIDLGDQEALKEAVAVRTFRDDALLARITFFSATLKSAVLSFAPTHLPTYQPTHQPTTHTTHTPPPHPTPHPTPPEMKNLTRHRPKVVKKW